MHEGISFYISGVIMRTKCILHFGSILLSIHILAGGEGEYINFLGNFILAQHSAGILFKYGRCS